MRERFEEFAARFAERASSAKAAAGGPTPHALLEEYWQGVRDLFTRDITQRGLTELIQHETPEAFRYFTREVDLGEFASRPWYQRYPLAVWRVFLAMAYRLSPPRRILFAVGVPMLGVSWIIYLLYAIAGQWAERPAYAWMLGGATLLFALLCLELRDKLVLKGELEVARQIQFGLLPFEPYAGKGLSVHAIMRPANTVGGDYFDLIELGDERLAVVVGDVAGKAMPAALLMALLQGSLRTLITAGLRGASLAAKLNEHLCANIPSNRLITLFYGEVDPTQGELHYVNAGHNAPFVLRQDGGLERLAATSVALGVLADAPFQAMVTPLEAGDRLVLFTDGVTEAFDRSEREYGEARLADFLETHRDLEGRRMIDGVVEDVVRFSAGARPHDDMTLMVVTRLAV
jgi:serine phosphatase RsbU (regulator of sigma subunit)